MGVSAAYHSVKAGFKTVLIEKGYVAAESAGKNGGMVVEGLAIDFSEAAEKFGKEQAVEAWTGTIKGKEYVASLVEENNIECDFSRPGSLYVATDKHGREILQNELTERQKAGFLCEIVSELNPPKDALLVKNDCALHPVKFIRGLAEISERAGLLIYEQTEALAYDATTVKTPQGIIRAKRVIVAIETAKSDILADQGVIKREIALVTEPLTPENISRLNWHQGGMFWSTEENYLTVRKIEDRLFLNGSIDMNPSEKDLDIAQEKVIGRFLSFAPRIPREGINISHRWTGLLLYPNRNRPYITEKNGYYELFGNGGNGLTNGIMLSKLIVDFFKGKDIPEIYKD
jgi:gamma-glutamylputrescine oxidase